MKATTKQYLVASLAAALMAAGLIATAGPAKAGCQDAVLPFHPFAQKCDGPIQADGTWQRCLRYNAARGLIPVNDCQVMSPDQPPPSPALSDPPTHIDP